MSNRSVVGYFLWLLVALACAGRLIHLDADPSFPTWIGYVVDEGRWSETARNLALFGEPDVNWLSKLHLFMSPGYQAVNYAVFRGFGVDFWTARLFAAVAGIFVVLTVFLALRRHVHPLALAFGVVVLGLETNLFWLSRMALPEIPAALATLLAFVLLVCGPKTHWSALLAGLVAIGAVAMKGTSILVLLVFPVLALTVPQELPVRTRIARSIMFVVGFALPVVAGVTGLFALGYLKADAVGDSAGRFLEFLSLTRPYEVLMRFFDIPELEVRNVLLLGAWFCSWLWFHRQSRAPSVASNLYLASGIWGGWWLIVWSANIYFPGRYLVHFIVPATIHIIAGLSLGGRDTVARIATSLAQRKGLTLATVLLWLVLPSAVVMASVVAGLAGLGGWNAERLFHRIALVVALAGLMVSFAIHRPISERSVVGFLLFPVAMTLVWLGASELDMLRRFWDFDSAASVALWSAAALAAFALCFIVAPRARVRERPERVGAAVIALLTIIFLAQAAPPILFATYSLRNASRDLAQHLPADQLIRTVTAGSLFLENEIKYREMFRSDTQLDGVVILEHGGVARKFLASEKATKLVRIAAYPLTVSPKYRGDDNRLEVPVVGIYRAK